MTFLHPKQYGNFRRKTRRPIKRKRQEREGMSLEFLDVLRQLPCAADRAYAEIIDPHHLMLKHLRGQSLRAPDRYAIPLSRARHDELHRYGSRRHEAILLAWGIDGEALANTLWRIFCHEPAADRLALMRAAVMEHHA